MTWPTREAQRAAPARSGLPRGQRNWRAQAVGTPEAGSPASGHSLERVRITPLSAPAPQAKLTVSTPGDKWEREADRVADQVMRLNLEDEPSAAHSAAPEGQVQRMCDGCAADMADTDDEEDMIQTAAPPGRTPQLEPGVGQRVREVQGGGQPLPASERAFFEPRFGADFSAVRLHHDERAAETARALDARAYTLGPDVVMGSSAPTPGTREGRRLLAHELTHVVQQSGDASASHVQRDVDDACYIARPQGPYSNLSDAGYPVGSYRNFTAAQQTAIYAENYTRPGIHTYQVTAGYESDESGDALARLNQVSHFIAEIDHIVPWDEGGCNSFRNALVLSKDENRAKGSTYPWNGYNGKRVLDPTDGSIYNSKAAANNAFVDVSGLP